MKPKIAQPAMAIMAEIKGLSPSRVKSQNATYPPSIITSPWAIFNKRMVPHIRFRPIAIKAYIEPIVKPSRIMLYIVCKFIGFIIAVV